MTNDVYGYGVMRIGSVVLNLVTSFVEGHKTSILAMIRIMDLLKEISLKQISHKIRERAKNSEVLNGKIKEESSHLVSIIDAIRSVM